MRPKGYYYWDQLIEHIGSPKKIFNGNLIYPRQLEIHLPGNGTEPCNFHCFYCAGKTFIKDLGNWEEQGLELIKELDGRIPFHIHGGSYTEPTMNPYLLDYLRVAKETGCHFGIHTNGSMLWKLEKEKGFLTQLCDIAEDKIDYLSISLDAGSAASHCMTKGLKKNWFSEILAGIRRATELRDEGGNKPAIRICYLMNRYNSMQNEIDFIVDFAKRCNVDSLRFSIPFAPYGQSFKKVKRYKYEIEVAREKPYYDKVRKHLTNKELPHIFWFSPKLQDVELLDFKECSYGYYQVCMGADGYIYRCTTISTPSFKKLRLGSLPNRLEDFNQMIQANQRSSFDTDLCFRDGARCNRMGIEINTSWRNLNL